MSRRRRRSVQLRSWCGTAFDFEHRFSSFHKRSVRDSAMYTANTVYTCGVEHVNSAHAHCVKCRDVTVKKKRVETFRKIYGMVTQVVMHLYINCMPHYPPPGLPWGHSGDLSPPVFKFPNTGANSAVNSLTNTRV